MKTNDVNPAETGTDLNELECMKLLIAGAGEKELNEIIKAVNLRFENVPPIVGLELKTAVKMCEDDEILYIGSSSGFFFVGTAAEFEKQIDTISDEYKKYYADKIDESRALMELAQEEIDIKLGKNESAASYIARMNQHAQTLAQAAEIFGRDYVNAERFTDIPTRMVTSAFRKTAEPGIAITVGGVENGKYWKKTEWDAAQRLKKKKPVDEPKTPKKRGRKKKSEVTE